MKTGTKIFVIVIVLFVGAFLMSVMKEASGHGANSSGSGGIFGMIIVIALFLAIRAIWKSQPDSEKSNNDNQQLDKS